MLSELPLVDEPSFHQPHGDVDVMSMSPAMLRSVMNSAGAGSGLWQAPATMQMDAKARAAALHALQPTSDPPSDANERDFSIGEHVAYWSDTHNTWMETQVTGVNYTNDGCLATYNLSVKNHALPSKVQPKHVAQAAVQSAAMQVRKPEVAVPTPLMNDALRSGICTPHVRAPAIMASERSESARPQLHLPISHQAEGDPEWAGREESPRGVSSPTQTETSFQVGEEVEYWSQTYKQWMPAKVSRLRDNGTYDLDVKKGAQPDKIRQRLPVASPPQQQREIADTGSHLHDVGPHLHDVPAEGEGRWLAKPRPSQGPATVELQAAAAANAGPDQGAGGVRLERLGTELDDKVLRGRSPADSPVSAAGYPVVRLQAPAPAVSSFSRIPAALFTGTGLEGRRKEADAAPKAALAQGQIVAPPRPRPSLHQAMKVERATAAPRQQVRLGRGASQGLELGELRLVQPSFDPREPSLAAQLRQGLGASDQASITEMEGFKGGLNEGVWYLTDVATGHDLVLKLVNGSRKVPNILTEAENLQKLGKEFPALAGDPTVAFPIKIFSCVSPDPMKRQDLIAMRKVKGERLAEFIAKKVFYQHSNDILAMLERLGACLADFHARYNNLQHGDFQPSNVFFDELTQEVFLIDIGGMGMPTMDNDVQHFTTAMGLLAEAYGHKLIQEGLRFFVQGYSAGARR